MALHVAAQTRDAQCERRMHFPPVAMKLFVAHSRLLGQQSKTLHHGVSSFSHHIRPYSMLIRVSKDRTLLIIPPLCAATMSRVISCDLRRHCLTLRKVDRLHC